MSLFTDETEAEYGPNMDASSFNSTLHAVINVMILYLIECWYVRIIHDKYSVKIWERNCSNLSLVVPSVCLNKESRTSEEYWRCQGRKTEERLEHKHLPQSSCFPLAPAAEAANTNTHSHRQNHAHFKQIHEMFVSTMLSKKPKSFYLIW